MGVREPIDPFIGDSGQGGTIGLVPAPPPGAGTSSPQWVLCADGIWRAPSGGGSSPNFADSEVPGGAINGTTGLDGNPTFTLAHTPNPGASLQLFKNGERMIAGIDFTLSAAAITYLAPAIPETGDTHIADYRY